MVASVLTSKHKQWAKDFAETLDFEGCCERHQMRQHEMQQTLITNGELQTLIRHYQERASISAKYLDEEHLKIKLYQLAMDEDKPPNARIQAIKLYYEIIGKKPVEGDTRDNLNKLMECLEDQPNAGENSEPTTTNTPTL